MGFYGIAELTYSLTNQIIISPIPSIPDFVYTNFAQKKNLNCYCMFTLHVLYSICKACDNLRMRWRTSKSARNILNDVNYALQRLVMTLCMSFTLTFA